MKNKPPLDENAALISNTLVCEVSRLFSEDSPDVKNPLYGFWSTRRTQFRIFDLMSLIEAIVLHDTIYTLPARLKSDVETLEFRRELIKHGVLKELDTKPSHQIVGNLILDGLGKIENPTKITASSGLTAVPINFNRSIKPLIEKFFLLPSKKGKKQRAGKSKTGGGIRLNDSYDFYVPHMEREYPLSANSFEAMGRTLLGWIEYYHSGEYERCTSILRDMYYIITSEFFLIPYWPQFTRIPFSKQFPNYFDKSFRLQLYGNLAKALKTTVAEIFDDLDEQVVFVPPFSALVFERSHTATDVVQHILTIRDEFAKLRKEFFGLEKATRTAKNIKERKRARMRQKKLLSSVAASFERRGKLKLQSILRYVPELVKTGVGTVDPAKYNIHLLSQPIEWIVEWWQQRPIAKLIDVGNKISEINHYEALITKLFGNQLGDTRPIDWEFISEDMHL